jgi:hypothetical protein
MLPQWTATARRNEQSVHWLPARGKGTRVYECSNFTRKVSFRLTDWAIGRGFHAGSCVPQVVSSLTDRKRRPLVGVVKNRCGIGPAKSLIGSQSHVHYGW